jgi:hypothetical protein
VNDPAVGAQVGSFYRGLNVWEQIGLFRAYLAAGYIRALVDPLVDYQINSLILRLIGRLVHLFTLKLDDSEFSG